jgi:FtsP/CotA-like multicopper oxidase with cupredoxin domain
MTFARTMLHFVPERLRTPTPRNGTARKSSGGIASGSLAMAAAALAMLGVPTLSAHAQTPEQPAGGPVECLASGQDLIRPDEIVSKGGILDGIITLTDVLERLTPIAPGKTTCPQQRVRAYSAKIIKKVDGEVTYTPIGENAPPADPEPGPTLRARIGELVQLSFVNVVDANRFNRNVVLGPNGCMQVGRGGETYPDSFDSFPNCLHASSTANIHYHGTHTNPNSTGDNVFLEIVPLPRDKGTLTTTPAQAMTGFESFFKECAVQLKNPLNRWPGQWGQWTDDKWQPWPWIAEWIAEQTKLLMAYEEKNPDQPEYKVWAADEDVKKKGGWPQYYIGAVPYCFALPYKPETEPVSEGTLRMGQAPGTHWYHAHKHGSTAINVMNGMTGAFIIEGRYDDELNRFYGEYVLKGGVHWNTRSQPVLVLNQLGTTPNLLSGAPGPKAAEGGVPFAVNGRIKPKARMQPGEVQLWRIVNTSALNAAYFMAPEGFQWRQLAQDGVQFARETYANKLNQNRPFYLAPGNRADLLVQAPMLTDGLPSKSFPVRIQAVMARAQVKPTPISPNDNDPVPGMELMTVEVCGSPLAECGGPVVTKDGQPMPFPPEGRAPLQPKFLTDITDEEWRDSNDAKNEFIFNSESGPSPHQHTINNHQFHDRRAANVHVVLGNVEEWTIKNTTNTTTGPANSLIDHPFHIHINPFQITEVFDPNENLVDPKTGKLETQMENGKTIAVPRYVMDKAVLEQQREEQRKNPGRYPFASRQCFLDPKDKKTWSVAGACTELSQSNLIWPPQSHLIWWDVFAIPSGRDSGLKEKVVVEEKEEEQPIIIPGYFKMRSRFVDYPGVYVMHCHILVHEDRGMMFTVEVTPEQPLTVHHD